MDTQSAKLLDVGMHKYLYLDQGRAAPLQEIKLDLLKGKNGEQYRQPFFWASFVMFGDGQ